MRHSWEKNKPRKKWSTCRNCGLEVPTYKIKKGGLPRCEPERALEAKKIDCMHHEHGAIAGVRYCWSCGKPYTEAEMEAGRIKREKAINGEKIEDVDFDENPPIFPI